MLGIAILGGKGPTPDILKKTAGHANILAAADSGLIAAEAAGLEPDWVVGDMDSLTSLPNRDGLKRLDKYPADKVLRYPAEKDYTDTELAITLLKEKGCDEIWLAGGGGGRTDHLLAIYSLFEQDDPPDRWYTDNEKIRCIREGRALAAALQHGSRVSVLPLGAGPWEAESVGLKWPLKGITWQKSGLGLSNATVEGPFEIRSIRGRFLVIWDLD